MDPIDFLSAVLPSSGIYCVAELSTSQKEHVFADTLAELQPRIEEFNAKKYNTYFALATFKDKESRTAANALLMRSFFLDLDCGPNKAYPTKSAAVEALTGFLLASSLPTPWLTSSGGGVHAYWPFLEHVPIATWKPAAENLKRLCKQHGLGIDFTVTADAARVLRMPGTTNWKDPAHPRKCVIKSVTHKHSFEDLNAAIHRTLEDPHDEGSSLFDTPGERLERRTTSTVAKSLDNRVTFFKTILDRTNAGTGCGQLANYINHAKDDGMEPIWRGLLSQAKVCVDGDKAAKVLSKLHPYSTQRMNQKLREIKGPYPCVKMDSEWPGICPKCPHWGRITNPLALGHTIQTDNEVKQVEIPAATPDAKPTTVTRPTPPHGYAYGMKGGVYRIAQVEDADGNLVPSNKQLLGYDLFAVDILNGGEDGHVVQMVAMRPEGSTTVTFPQRSISSKDEIIKALASQNIIASYGSGNDKHLYDYVRASVEEISASRRAIRVPTSFGWQKDSTFVLNGKIYSPEGEKPVPMLKLANIVSITEPVGSLEAWKEVPKLLVSKGYYDILAMSLISFGSPLMQFSDFKALTFHIGSSESGTGKSISLNLASSVWGGENYILSPKTSAVAQEHRVGSLGQLPLIIDEITEMNKDFEWLSSFVMDMTAGLGKDRMKSATNEERLNTTYWRALMLLASNTHATDFFSGVRKKASEGHLRRLLELKMETVLTWTEEEERVLGLMRRNYGVAGHAYVQWLVRNVAIAKDVTNKVYFDLKREVKATGDERFWVAGCSAAIAGGILLGPKYANIIALPMKEIVKSFTKMIDSARGTVKANRRTAEDILNAYTREFFGQFVVLRINDKTKVLETSFGSTGIVDKTLTRSHVKGRVEHDLVPGFVNYYIEEQQLKAWCSSMNYGYSDFRKQLEQAFSVTYGRKDLLSKTNGPQMRCNVVKIMRPATSTVDEIEEHEVSVE